MAGKEPIRGMFPIDDPSYRYQMPILTIKHEGRIGGTKTRLTNLTEIADSICRPEEYIMKYITNKLSCASYIKESSYILQGTFTLDQIRDTLYLYIHEYVLCPTCKLPETVLSYSKSKCILSHKCAACGTKNEIKSNSYVEWIIGKVSDNFHK